MFLKTLLLIVVVIVAIFVAYIFYSVGTHPVYVLLSKWTTDPIVRVVGTAKVMIEMEQTFKRYVIEKARKDILGEATSYGYVVMSSGSNVVRKKRKLRRKHTKKERIFRRNLNLITGFTFGVGTTTTIIGFILKILILTNEKARAVVNVPTPVTIGISDDGDGNIRPELHVNADKAKNWDNDVKRQLMVPEEVEVDTSTIGKLLAMDGLVKNELKINDIINKVKIDMDNENGIDERKIRDMVSLYDQNNATMRSNGITPEELTKFKMNKPGAMKQMEGMI